VYLALDPNIAAIQRQSVECLLEPQLPAEIAVLVFVEFIRKPDLSFEQLAKAISRNKGITVKTAQIERLLKKTIRTALPEHGWP
jgi:hypothetical protein